MDTLANLSSNTGIFSLMLDALLLIGIGALWIVWMRNGKRQQHLEQTLAETARQLQEASSHLEAATKQMAQLKSAATRAPAPDASAPAPSKTPAAKARVRPATAAVQPARHTPPAAAKRAYQPNASTRAPANSVNETRTGMILRMQREGETPAGIADKLELPLAQVRLLLKLQAASRHP